MKIRISFYLVLVLVLIARTGILHAQGESIEQITIFGSRAKAPIVLDVRDDPKNIYFNVINNSYFPYNFEVVFGEFRNLSPRVFEKKTILQPGINRLFTFKIVNPEEPPALSYQTKYYLAGSFSDAEIYKPYLIPVGENKTVELFTKKEENITKKYINQFVMKTGDTVFTSRKGTVTAIPGDNKEVDRIVGGNSLEIRHDDGTIAVYIGLDAEQNIVRPGKIVYPGEPVGITDSSKLLIFEVFEIINDGTIKRLEILYSGQNGQMIPSSNLNGTKAVYPHDVIIKEMTKREVSRYEKNTLF